MSPLPTHAAILEAITTTNGQKFNIKYLTLKYVQNDTKYTKSSGSTIYQYEYDLVKTIPFTK